MKSIFFLALALAVTSQTAKAADGEYNIVFKSKITLPANGSNYSKEVSYRMTLNVSGDSSSYCEVSAVAPPFSQPNFAANRELKVRPNPNSIYDNLIDPTSGAIVGKIFCKAYNEKSLAEVLKQTLNVEPIPGIKVYEIKADEDEIIHQNDGSTPTAI